LAECQTGAVTGFALAGGARFFLEDRAAEVGHQRARNGQEWSTLDLFAPGKPGWAMEMSNGAANDFHLDPADRRAPDGTSEIFSKVGPFVMPRPRPEEGWG
jgi:hypothetical protein